MQLPSIWTKLTVMKLESSLIDNSNVQLPFFVHSYMQNMITMEKTQRLQMKKQQINLSMEKTTNRKTTHHQKFNYNRLLRLKCFLRSFLTKTTTFQNLIICFWLQTSGCLWTSWELSCIISIELEKRKIDLDIHWKLSSAISSYLSRSQTTLFKSIQWMWCTSTFSNPFNVMNNINFS